jgi:hypothetical protein
MARESTDSPGRTSFLVALLGGALLAYIVGAYTATFQVAPYTQVLRPYFRPLMPGEVRKVLPSPGAVGARQWRPADGAAGGVEMSGEDGDRSGGVTFYTSGDRPRAVLVGEGGEELASWGLRVDEAWAEGANFQRQAEPSRVFWRDAHLYPNGDVAAIYEGGGRVPSGQGLVMVDRDSELRWRYAGQTHSDLAVGGEGEVYALTHRYRRAPEALQRRFPQLPDKMLGESVVVLSRGGERRASVSLGVAFARSRFQGLMAMYPEVVPSAMVERGQVFDASSVAVIGAEFAREHDFAEAGDVMVALRALDAVAVVDMQAGQVKWASRGSWWRPSDVEPLANGTLLVFDQDGHGGPGMPSRVVEIDPETGAMPWVYTGSEGAPMWTREGGSVQRLEDGGALVTVPGSSEMREVGADGELRWRYRNPVRRERGGRAAMATLWGGQRFGREELEFLEGGGDE